MPLEIVTPYSTVTPYISGFPDWIPEADQERVMSYQAYENMYWSVEDAFQIIRRGQDGEPVYVPNPRTVVDTTSHYLLKGLQIGVADPEKNVEFKKFLDDFLAREKFYSRVKTAKHAGVVRGDWLFHITADPEKPEGSRISLTTLDPGSYFPVYDDDDLDKVIGVRIVQPEADPDNPTRSLVRIKQYGYLDNGPVFVQEDLWDVEAWNDPKRARHVRSVLPYTVLPPEITQIPIYHFKNYEWDGQPFGNSELRGFETLLNSINQTVSDTDIALALAGLGCYATDGGHPVDANGNPTDWVIYPGSVLEVPGATMIKRLEGIASVTPVYEHVNYLEQSLRDASGTSDAALGRIDVQTAESPIGLAIKFMPTLAKIEQRDTSCIEILTQMFFDIKRWFSVYESASQWLDIDIVVTIGEKLPINRAKLVEELNNMKDRKVISARTYRAKMAEIGYDFPDDEEAQIIAEEVAHAEALAKVQTDAAVERAENMPEPPQPQILPGQNGKLPGPGGRLRGAGDTLPKNAQSKSNNAKSGNTNESRGTELDSSKG